MREKSQIVSELTFVVLENGSFSGLKNDAKREGVRQWVVKDSLNLSPLAQQLLNTLLCQPYFCCHERVSS